MLVMPDNSIVSTANLARTVMERCIEKMKESTYPKERQRAYAEAVNKTAHKIKNNQELTPGEIDATLKLIYYKYDNAVKIGVMRKILTELGSPRAYIKQEIESTYVKL